MGKHKNERFELRVTAAMKRRWAVSAAIDERSLSDWIRDACNAAVKAKESTR